MGSLKDKVLENDNEDIKQHELSEPEFDYLKLLNTALQFHTWQSRIQSGFLYYVATTRLGYTPNTNLMFQIDLSKEDRMLMVKVLPEPEEPKADTN